MDKRLEKEELYHKPTARQNFSNPLYENLKLSQGISGGALAGGMDMNDFSQAPELEELSSSAGGMDIESFSDTLAGVNIEDGNSSSAGGMSIPPSDMDSGIANTLDIRGGLPTIASIEQMAGGLQLGKISKHMAFSDALYFLDEYQKIMIKNHSVPGSSFEVGFTEIPMHKDTGTVFCKGDIDSAFEALGNFIINATKAVNTSWRLGHRYSSNVKKLTPIFASMLVQANMQLSKLANLENAVASYLIKSDSENFNFSDLLTNMDVTGGRGGRIATTGLQENDSTADVSPKEINKILANNGDDVKEKITKLTGKRRDAVMQARLNLQIPKFPFGITEGISDSEEKTKLVEHVIDTYISQLRLLNLALDDVAEEKAEEGSDAEKDAERKKVHAAKAEYFQLGKLIYQAANDKTAMMAAARGLGRLIKQDSKFLKLDALGGTSLGTASQVLNEEFRNPANFARLKNSAGKNLVGGRDYKVGGGGTSIAIIDKVNKRVMRAPMRSNKYLSEDEQKASNNGMFDDATDKVGRLLGFNVIAKADAANFVAKDAIGSEENVMGGSLMSLAKGQTGNAFDLVTKRENAAVFPKGRDKLEKLVVGEQGRMLEDFMKMQVVDYICLHADRHSGNYLINPKASPNESMITAIDNDMIFGVNNVEKFMGYEGSADALQSIKERGAMDFQSKLDSSFPMMTESVRNALKNLDIDQLDMLLTPYADRVVRMAALHRAAELKALAETTEICDLSTKEGTEAFTKLMIKNGMTNWVKAMKYKEGRSNFGHLYPRQNGSGLVYAMTYGVDYVRNVFNPNDGVNMIFYMKLMGLSSEEIKTMFLENIEVEGEDRLIAPEELDKMKGLKDIDLSLEEYDQKYNCSHNYDSSHVYVGSHAQGSK